jgi:hypothetical protein
VPAQPVRCDRPPTGRGWVHEIKHDGYRVLVRRDGALVGIYSRNAINWTDRFSTIAAVAATLEAHSFTIDRGRRQGVRARLPAWCGRHRVEAGRLVLPLGPAPRLDQDQEEPGLHCRAARAQPELEQIRSRRRATCIGDDSDGDGIVFCSD